MLLRTYAAALAYDAGEKDAALGRYSRHVIDDIAGQFNDLPPEEWDANILIDKDHIHHLGDALAGMEGPDGALIPGYVQAIVLGDTPVEALAGPEPPETMDDLRREIVGEEPSKMVAALIERGSDFAVVVKSYVFQRRVAEGR
ncbi:MAG: hypothetical protein K8S97_07850, partial [Anaerolineae bacterium]|nr:hypothetical protein [Anaerolineae bacterium]